MTTLTHKGWYGWHPDRPDHRDHLYAAPGPLLQTLPPAVDLRPQCPPIYDQQALGSCTANAIAGAIEFDQRRQGLPEATPSRLFIYFNERQMEGTTSVDSGARIRDGIKSVNRMGECPETLWPYDISQFAVKPPLICYQNALAHRVLKYQRVLQNLNQMKACLAGGYPIIFGITVYQSFESPDVMQSGDVPMPGLFESALGGHALVACGYSDADQRFYFRNSWSTSYGQQGYGTIPYTYLLDSGLAADFWTIQVVE